MSKKIGIVGLGLIGGSIEKNLSSKGYELMCVSKSQNKEYELKDLKDCDVVFLCASQKDIYKQLGEIAQIVSQSSEGGSVDPENRAFAKTIITDAGSTKSKICTRAQELGLENFVGGHPMAGTEKSGYEASFPELFEGATWVLTESSPKTQLLETIIKELGAELVTLDPETHDKAVAAVSHLSLALSLGLADVISDFPQAQKVVGPGFKGMTRLARGNVKLGRDMLAINRENVKEMWQNCKSQVDSMLDLPAPALLEELNRIKASLAEETISN